MPIKTATLALSIAILASSSGAKIIASSTLTGGLGWVDLSPDVVVTYQMFETDFLTHDLFGDVFYSMVAVDNPTVFVDWSFSASDVGQRYFLDSQSDGWDLLITQLTNNELNFVNTNNIFVNPNDDVLPSITFGRGISDSDLLGAPNDLAGAAIDYIELELTSFEFFIDDEYNLPSISYTIDFNVHGTVPTPATLLPLSMLLFSRRRR